MRVGMELSQIRTIRNNVAILVLLLALILVPRPVAGLFDFNQARRFEADGNLSASVKAYKDAAERIWWRPSIWEKAGIAAEKNGNQGEAITFLQRAAERNALSQDGWRSLGAAYQKIGDFSSAVNAWTQALPAPEAYRSLAEDQRKLGDFSEAVKNWGAYLQLEPNDALAHFQLGLLEATTSPEEALPDLMKAAQLDSSLDHSVQNLRSALNTAFLSNDPAYQFLIAGRAVAALGEWDLAAEAFRNAAQANPDYGEAWGWLGEARQQLGEDGSMEIKKALALNPDSAMLESLYGLYLQRQKQPEQALVAFQKAAALEPDNSGWQMALGGAYEQTGDLVAALEHYQRASELSPEKATVWQALAQFSLRNGVDLIGTGLPAARKLVELAKDDWQADDIAGQVLLETGDLVGAEALLKKAVELDPTQAAPALHLGLVYVQNGNRAGAYSYLNLAKAFDPDGPYGWQANRLLEQFFP
jgi:tetratricopeptide (TPR) repeat protein